MFLTKNNNLKIKSIIIAAVFVLALTLLGMVWFDAPLLLFLRRFDCRVWYWIGKIFDAKVWLITTAVVVAAFYARKAVDSKPNIRNSRNKINLWAILDDFYLKTKHSYAFLMFCAVFGASVAVSIIKVVVGRFRPVFFEALDLTGFHPFSFEWAFNSMPSGHTAASFAGLVMLGLLVPKIKWATWTLAIVIGLSRVVVGAHWPTDVLVGAFIGMVAADVARAYLARRD